MSDSVFTVDVVQFLRPEGKQIAVTTKLPIRNSVEVLADLYLDMLGHGCRFETEVLRTEEVSVTISDPKRKIDVDVSVTPNGPEVQRGMIEILKRQSWKNKEN